MLIPLTLASLIQTGEAFVRPTWAPLEASFRETARSWPSKSFLVPGSTSSTKWSLAVAGCEDSLFTSGATFEDFAPWLAFLGGIL